MQAAILSIGDELTLGQTVDTNAAWLSARLAEHGVTTLYHLTVPDEVDAIVDAFRRAADDAELVLATGGLGPTDDDLTRQALARAMGAELELHERSLRRIEAMFRRRHRPMAERNKVQAMRPIGCETLDNPRGTAPGLTAKLGRATIHVMPGVPAEMTGMFDDHILPTLTDQTGQVILTAKLNTIGTGESDIAQMLGDLADRARNPLVGTTASAGIVSVRIRSTFADEAEAKRQLDDTARRVTDCLGPLVFGRDDQTLAEAVGIELAARKQTLATAESCTGGLVGKMLTDVSGSSDYYLGGWVVYANDAKQQLGVPAALIDENGAVSEPVARSLAECALSRTGADYALSLTGIAGPTGGSRDKPVGTTWIALACREVNRIDTAAHRIIFPGERPIVRLRAAHTALNLLRLHLINAEH